MCALGEAGGWLSWQRANALLRRACLGARALADMGPRAIAQGYIHLYIYIVGKRGVGKFGRSAASAQKATGISETQGASHLPLSYKEWMRAETNSVRQACFTARSSRAFHVSGVQNCPVLSLSNAGRLLFALCASILLDVREASHGQAPAPEWQNGQACYSHSAGHAGSHIPKHLHLLTPFSRAYLLFHILVQKFLGC